MGVPYAEVIGDPIAHSKSPLIHKFWLEKLGMEGDYRAVRLTPAELPGYFEDRRGDPGWRGCNVTMPLKDRVLDQVERLDPFARRARAANTVVREESGRLTGHNTDVRGFLDALEDGPEMAVPEHHVATYFQLIGAGGAARAVATAIGGADIVFYNRTKAGADRLADEYGAGSEYGFSGDLEGLSPAHCAAEDLVEQPYSYIIVNASPMGMTGYPPVPIRLDSYPRNTLVFDLVYEPLETPLLREARRLNMLTIDGLDMLVAQASHAFELLFGAAAPREHDAELRALLTS